MEEKLLISQLKKEKEKIELKIDKTLIERNILNGKLDNLYIKWNKIFEKINK